MRILVFSHYYYPEGNAPASRMSAVCSHWASQGHDVEVITCAPNVPNGVVYEGYVNRLLQSETLERVQVTRVWTYLSANKGAVRRILNFLSYMLAAVFVSWFRRRPDVIVATSPQFFCGWAGFLASRMRIRRVPFVLEIRDLWPDSIVAVGAMRNKRLLRLLYRLERWLYAGSDHIVTVGEGYWEDLVDKGVPCEKLSIIPNGVDRGIFWPRQATDMLARFGMQDRFTCAYVGTIGMAAGLEVVIEAAELLRDQGRNDISFLLVGDGAEREKLEKIAHEKELDNLAFSGMLPKEKMPEVLAATDVCLVHLRKVDLFKRVMPSKIFEMAAMKRPIILGVAGHAAKLLQTANAGVCIEPENARELVDAVCTLASDPAACRAYGQSGHDYVVQHHDRAVLADKYVNILNELVHRLRPDVAGEAVLPMAEAIDGPAEERVELPAEQPVEKAA
jgi:glycosyltransferase involved in cell wall biosynthesis